MEAVSVFPVCWRLPCCDLYTGVSWETPRIMKIIHPSLASYLCLPLDKDLKDELWEKQSEQENRTHPKTAWQLAWRADTLPDSIGISHRGFVSASEPKAAAGSPSPQPPSRERTPFCSAYLWRLPRQHLPSLQSILQWPCEKVPENSILAQRKVKSDTENFLQR